MEKVSENSKRIATKIAIAILAILLVSSTLVLLGNSLITESFTATPLSPAKDYGDIMQYDWPQAGYDEGNTGFNPGPAPDRSNVLWSVTGRGSGMVTAFDGMIFTTSRTTLYATDPFNGTLIYAVDAPGTPSITGTNPVFKLDDTYLLTQGSAGIVGRKIATGEVVWNATLPYSEMHPGSMRYLGGHYSTSAKMYFNCAYDYDANEAQVVAFDISDPSTEPPIAWKYVADESSEILCSGDGKVFLGSTEGKIWALDRNGTRVWQTATLGGIAQQSAIYYNGKLYTSAVSWQVTCFDGETGDRLWQAEKGIRAFSAYRGTAGMGMFFDTTVETDPHGHVRAWDAETGELLWKQPAYFRISYTMMACADGKVYTTTCDSSPGSVTAGLVMPGYEFTCFDAFTGTVLWKLRGLSFSTPSIAYGNLYGVTGGSLYCIGGDPADWTHGLHGNVENPRVAVGQQGPADISCPRWVFQTGGDVFSSPAVVDGKVYVGSHDKNWYCLDAYTGEKIWSFPIGHYVRTSAAVAGGRVFTGADDGYFYCINATTGAQIWKTDAGGHFPNYLTPNEAEARSCPIVVGDRIYVGSLDGKVYCLDPEDGHVLLTYATGGPIMGSPAYSDDTIYITSTDSYLYALNAADLSFKWKSFPLNMSIGVPTPMEHYNIGTPTVAGNTVFIGGGLQYGRAVPGVDYAAMNMSTPAYANGGGIRFFAFNATTGASIWNVSRTGNTQPIYVPCYWDGQIYAPEFFDVTAMNATNPTSGTYVPADYTTRDRISGNRTIGQWLGYQIQGSVAYADDLTGPKIYVGCDIGSVYCLDPRTMTTLSLYTIGSNTPCSPAIWDGKMYVGSVNGQIYCFDDSPTVDFSISAESNKGAKMWNNETIVIEGRLISNPYEMVWDGDAYVPVASDLHPGMPNAEIKASLTKPDNTDVPLTTTTDNEGYFSFSYNPTEVGKWGWVVYYEGKRTTGLTYNMAYGEWNEVTVTSPTTSNGGVQPPPEKGIPTEYIYAIVAVIAIIIIAIAAYAYMKRGKK